MKHINFRISLIDSVLIEDKKKYHFSKENFEEGEKKSLRGNQPLNKREMLQKRYEEKGKEESEKYNNRKGEYPITRYKNYSRKSGVYAYGMNEEGTDIHIYFSSGAIYKYNTESAPIFRIREMIKRAKSGWGLNRYLNWKRPGYYYKGRWK